MLLFHAAKIHQGCLINSSRSVKEGRHMTRRKALGCSRGRAGWTAKRTIGVLSSPSRQDTAAASLTQQPGCRPRRAVPLVHPQPCFRPGQSAVRKGLGCPCLKLCYMPPRQHELDHLLNTANPNPEIHCLASTICNERK